MPLMIRSILLSTLVAGVMVSHVRTTRAQGSTPSTWSISVTAASPASAIADLDTRVAQMVAAGQLVRTYAATDRLAANRRHEYFAQRHQGIPVAGGGLSRQIVDGSTASAFGSIYLGIDIGVAPSLTGNVAMAGLQDVAAAGIAPGGGTRLVVLPEFDGSYRLTYQGTFLDGTIRFVDAVTGDLVRTDDAFVTQRTVGTGVGAHGDLKKISTLQGVRGFETVDQFRPAEIRTRSTQGSNTSVFGLFAGAGSVAADTDNTWSNPAVVDAHVNAGLTYDYFHQRMGWQGLDGANSPIDQVVADHATIPNNAFFSPPASSSSSVGLMAFGMSDANYPMATLDIVGHEAMHGVTYFSLRQRTGTGLWSALIPDGLGPVEARSGGQDLACDRTVLILSNGAQAPFLCEGGRYVLTSNHGGAINEGFSDVFGTAIEFAFQPPGDGPLRADYAAGEDTAAGGAAAAQAQGLFRSLSDPASVAAESTGVVRYPDHFDRRVRYTLYEYNGQIFISPWSIVDGQFIFVSTDSGGVHINATIMGHVFYRAIEGGTHRTSGRPVAGVGAANRDLIEKIFFRAMNVLMPATATLQTAAATLRQSAADLYGSSSAAYRAIDESLQAAGLQVSP